MLTLPSITFLATLLVLLVVSCVVVFRSYVIRRRYPLHLDEAIAAGIILAPRTQGGRRRRLAAKPRLFTSCLVQGGERWNQMMVCPSSTHLSLVNYFFSHYLHCLFRQNAAPRTSLLQSSPPNHLTWRRRPVPQHRPPSATVSHVSCADHGGLAILVKDLHRLHPRNLRPNG